MNRPHNQPSFTVQEVDWTTAEPHLREIRQQVFIEEQKVPVALEWDGLDDAAMHLLASDARGNAVGCARILDGGVIGRMAVRQPWRGLGVGNALLEAAIAYCRKRSWAAPRLSAQNHAISFYEGAGFIVCSEEYMDAGIPHRDMRLELSI